VKVFIVLTNYGYEQKIYGVYSSFDLAVANAQNGFRFIEEQTLDENKPRVLYFPKKGYNRDGDMIYKYVDCYEVKQ